jgi:hypothetical protein
LLQLPDLICDFAAHDLVERVGRGSHGVLEEPVEKQTPYLRSPPGEAGCDLVKVVVEMFERDRPLMRAEEPALQQ